MIPGRLLKQIFSSLIRMAHGWSIRGLVVVMVLFIEWMVLARLVSAQSIILFSPGCLVNNYLWWTLIMYVKSNFHFYQVCMNPLLCIWWKHNVVPILLERSFHLSWRLRLRCSSVYFEVLLLQFYKSSSAYKMLETYNGKMFFLLCNWTWWSMQTFVVSVSTSFYSGKDEHGPHQPSQLHSCTNS